MKKIDKLILSSFLGPFILTFLVVVFILLTQHMLKYFDDIIGKDLGWDVLGTLLFYFAIFMTPVAMPLAVLLSSLITFGNLGEHFELTAIKSLGISMVRSLLPIFCFVVFLTGIAFWANNNLVPKAALEAYSRHLICARVPSIMLSPTLALKSINAFLTVNR
jgi:lipopolysaccharide export system permease protein